MGIATKSGSNPRTTAGVTAVKELGMVNTQLIPGLTKPCAKLTDIFGFNNPVIDRVILCISVNPQEREETMQRVRAREIADDDRIAAENLKKTQAFIRAHPEEVDASIFQMYAATPTFIAAGNVMPGL